MAGVQVGSEGGRRSVDSGINMVPMIDLLVSMIGFLLMTAVWTQAGALRTQQPGAPADGPDPPPYEEHLRVVVTPTGFDVGRTALDIRHVDANGRQLAELRRELTDRHRADPQGRQVWIQPDGAVQYDDVIRVMDVVYDVWNEGQPADRPRSERVIVSMM